MKMLLKWIAVAVGVLAALVVIVAIVVFAITEIRMNKSYAFQPAALEIPTDADSIAEGRRLFVSRGCSDCHGQNLEGKVFIDDPAVGIFAGRNLTSGAGGVGGGRETADFVRAVRNGIGADGKPLLFMPSQEFYPLNDGDLSRLIAFIKNAPPVDSTPPDSAPGPLMRFLFLIGEVPLLAAELIDHDAPRPAAVTSGASVEYGEYLANGCTGCHGNGYSGGAVPGVPPDFPHAANITPDAETGIGLWQQEDFFRALREGVRPDGSSIDPFMPWQNFKQLTDEEIGALWAYLRTVPAKKRGNR